MVLPLCAVLCRLLADPRHPSPPPPTPHRPPDDFLWGLGQQCLWQCVIRAIHASIHPCIMPHTNGARTHVHCILPPVGAHFPPPPRHPCAAGCGRKELFTIGRVQAGGGLGGAVSPGMHSVLSLPHVCGGGYFGNSGWVGVQSSTPPPPPGGGGTFWGGEQVGAKGAARKFLPFLAFGEWVARGGGGWGPTAPPRPPPWIPSSKGQRVRSPRRTNRHPPSASMAQTHRHGFSQKSGLVCQIAPPNPPPPPVAKHISGGGQR